MIKNILAIRNDRFGEFLLNIPAMRALKEVYPQAKLSLAVSSAVCELAGAVECVDEAMVWDEVKGNLKKHKFDLCVVLNPTKEAHWAVFCGGIPVRVGYSRKWGFLLTHKLKDTKQLGDRHEVDCNLELVNLIASGASRPRNDGGLRFPNNDKYEFLAGAVAIHPFTSDLVKQWPVERFKELAQRIKRELGLRVAMVGKNEIASAPAAPRNDGMGDGIVDMINKTSLVELAALLKRCSLLISCDSGPVHLAASVGTPVVALFRNDLLGKTAKRWGPWGDGHVVIEKGNLLDISVDEVFDKVKQRLLRSPSANSQ
ncbi:MAG: glycosyltransferase family 9 protein [Candidatus Omnitrophica bacterium]|nr:glycosyltransferase family 9 protein [Candidatus Omnitrophota bacterium]